MKSKILISVFLITICIFYSFKNMTYLNDSRAIVNTSSYQQDSFIIGAMYNSRDANYAYLRDTMNFNIWHTYTAPNQESKVFGWPGLYSNLSLPNDWLENPVNNYSSAIRERMALNNTKNLRTLIDRPKFQYLAFGQRSDYQCEKADTADPDYWFYTYYNSVDNGNSIKDIQDFTKGSGEFVKQCLYDRTNPGTNAQILFDSLKGNLEQVNNFWQAPWVGDSKYEWYIMPRIRIDSAFANNPLNQEVEVCRIITRNRVGDSLTQVIKVKNFKPDLDSIYRGNYIEMYFPYPFDPLTNLVIPVGNWFNNDPESGINDTDSKVDFKVFWYDKCDMWIDRIRVENQPAHRMITLHDSIVEEWIRAEVEDIAMAEVDNGNNSPYKFYVEEFEMSHLPCIGYLNKKIIEYSNGRFSLMVNYNHDLLKLFIPNSYDTLLTANQITKYLIDSAGLKEIFTECYGLEGWRNTEHGGGRESYVPNTLYNGPDYQPDQGLLVYKTTPQNYDYWLQEHFDNYKIKGNEYTHIFKLSDEISKIADIPFLNLAQAHMWRSPGHILKEPSNEELSLMNNLAISYGARGILYFSWNSSNENFDTSEVYSRGITNTDDTPRRLNVYGQNKWEGVKKINATLKKWGPYLMSFDNTNRKSYIVRSEISDLTNETYFNDILSYQPDPYDFSIPVSLAEPIGQRYLQAAVFKNPDEEYSKYFMIVNRRCSPIVASDSGGVNGKRSVTIKLDSGSSIFPEFNNWGVYDLEKDTLIKSFDKRLISTIHLSWFLPGEGKLYKIAPVVMEGGTLVADESVSGSFDCKGLVNNGGKNITLIPGTTINFANSDARIVMNGGDFSNDALMKLKLLTKIYSKS